jgi:hypothetical protein
MDMRASSFAVLIALALVSNAAAAETRQVSATIYATNFEEPKSEKLGATGVDLSYGRLLNGHTVSSTGEFSSQWCQITTAGKDGQSLGGAGFCTVIEENGDMFWVWLRVTGDTTNDWGLIGGTGQYVGATGGGTTKLVKTLPDGTQMYESKGTVTTK